MYDPSPTRSPCVEAQEGKTRRRDMLFLGASNMLSIRMAKFTLRQAFDLGCQQLHDQCGVCLGEILDSLRFQAALLFKITPQCHHSMSSHPKIFTRTSDCHWSDVLSSYRVPGTGPNALSVYLIGSCVRRLQGAAPVLKTLRLHQFNRRTAP